MMTKSLVDMSRPNMFYAAGLGLVMLVSLAVSNIPALAFSQYVDFPFRREVCAGLFIGSTLFGAIALQRHMQRAKMPWRIPQSQVAYPYLGFIILALVALVIAH